MPPPMPNPAKRMTANPARPVARYRPGKGAQEESSEEDDDEEEDTPQPVSTQRKPSARPIQAPRPPIPASPEDEDDDEEGFVTDEEDDKDDGRNLAPAKVSETKPVLRTSQIQKQGPAITRRISGRSAEESSGEEEEESEEDDDDSEEEESSSEDEAPQRKFQRPTFIKKNERKGQNVTASGTATLVADSKTTDVSNMVAEPLESTEVDEQARRLAQADLMIKDKLERDAIARAAGKKAWDDDDDLAPEDLVDDTDGIDPDAEYAAWRLRELQRLKRDREAMIAREKELEEVERRRNLTAEEREKEDREFLENQKAEREEGRSQGNYLSKYHHKGAFFQDDEAAEVLRKRDLMGAKFADDVSDKSALPEYMRIRDMTKLGKKGRTRYTDLKGQDTGRFGDEVKRWKGSGYDNVRGRGEEGTDTRGMDERFLPDREREGRGPTASGANASAVGFRKRRSRSRSPKRRRDDSRDKSGGDSYRPAARRRSYSRSRSISRSPPPPGRRRRSPSPYHDRDRNRDKRRRIET